MCPSTADAGLPRVSVDGIVMEYVIGIALIGLIAFGTWSFYTSGRYPAKRTSTPDLSGFWPPTRSERSAPPEARPPVPGSGQGGDDGPAGGFGGGDS